MSNGMGDLNLEDMPWYNAINEVDPPDPDNLGDQLTYDEIMAAYEGGTIQDYLFDKFEIPKGHDYMSYIDQLDPMELEALLQGFNLNKADTYRKFAGDVKGVGETVGGGYKTVLDSVNAILGKTGFETSGQATTLKAAGEDTLFDVYSRGVDTLGAEKTSNLIRLEEGYDLDVRHEKELQVSDWYRQVADVDTRLQQDAAARRGGGGGKK